MKPAENDSSFGRRRRSGLKILLADDADPLPDFLEAVEAGGRAGGYRLAVVLAHAHVPQWKVGFAKGMDLRYWYGDE